MYLKPAAPIEGASVVELWDEDGRAAMVYATRTGLHIICEAGWEPDARPGGIAVEIHEPAGILASLRRVGQ